MTDAATEAWEAWRPYGSVSNPMYEPHIEAAFLAGFAAGRRDGAVEALTEWADELDKPPYSLWDRAAIPRLRARAAELTLGSGT